MNNILTVLGLEENRVTENMSNKGFNHFVIIDICTLQV